jgi:translin
VALARRDELAALAAPLRERLDAANAARETGLGAARRTIQFCSQSIRATHRLDWNQAADLADAAEATLREAQEALRPYPQLAASGPLHDAAKEYAEARLTLALAADRPLPSAQDIGVADASWLNGLAEAASELRRHLLDRLRAGEMNQSERLLTAMDDVYALLVTVDYPDALTGGLRRTTDALRPVLERTRGDLTTTILQQRLQQAIEGRLPE